jgi:cell division septation protein DedD
MAKTGERDSRRFRFDLSRLELAGLVVSTAASLFIVFLLGVWAGRGLGDRRLEEPERIVRVPVAPAAPEETPGPEQDLTFDARLGDDDHPARPDEGGARGPAHAAADAAGAPVPPPAPEAVAAAPHAAAPEHAEPRPAPVPVPHPPAEHAAPGAAPAPPRPAEASVAVALAKPGTAAPPPAAALPASIPGGAWSVQVSATRDPQTADDVLKRLRAKGYEAYIVKARREGAMFYRVRVGHYGSMEHASQMVSRLRREPGVPEAFVASD